jgi:hypothetical protein
MRDAAGGLLGVVAALLDIGNMSQMLDTLGVGQNGVVSVRRIDAGKLILSRPSVPEQVNQALLNNPLQMRLEAGRAFGTLRFHTAIDGVERIYGFRRVGDYPLYVTAGLATADYLAAGIKPLPWQASRRFFSCRCPCF